jgi:N-glycosylase/DNA lyase
MEDIMDIKTLKKEYNKRKAEIEKRLHEFKNQKDHFYELCFCLLTPQSNAYKCNDCIQVLKEGEFVKKDLEINNILRKYTRFHNNKSNYLIRIKDTHGKVFSELGKLSDPKNKRAYLVDNVKGLGLKEASHFLRNIGHENLAILDRHILKNLHRLGVIKEIPRSLTKKVYLDIEKQFQNFSEKVKIPMDHLDLLFWSMQTGSVFK